MFEIRLIKKNVTLLIHYIENNQYIIRCQHFCYVNIQWSCFFRPYPTIHSFFTGVKGLCPLCPNLIRIRCLLYLFYLFSLAIHNHLTTSREGSMHNHLTTSREGSSQEAFHSSLTIQSLQDI